MRRMTKKEQWSYARRRAPELARSGQFAWWWPIEVHLRVSDECPEARHALDDKRIRDELDKLCQQARPDGSGPKR
jgi:hypothetical protein